MKYTFENNALCFNPPVTLNNQSINDLLNYLKINSKNKNYLITNHFIFKNNQPTTINTTISNQDKIKITIYKPQNTPITNYPYDLDIVYEDELVLIVNKPANMLVYTDTKDYQTLSNAVANYYSLKNLSINVRPIHRLDYATCGLVMFSKSEIFQPLFDQQLMDKNINRRYYALVNGKFPVNYHLTIDKAIGANRHLSNRYLINPKGKKAITHISMLSSKNNLSLLDCKLETGRTHQIRVHLASIKHPIINDNFYGTAKEHTKLCLQAYQLSFYHPIQEKKIIVKIPLDKYIKKTMTKYK